MRGQIYESVIALDALVAALDPRVASAPDRLTSSCLLYAALVSADLDSATYNAEPLVSNQRPVAPIKDGSRRFCWPVGANAQAGRDLSCSVFSDTNGREPFASMNLICGVALALILSIAAFAVTSRGIRAERDRRDGEETWEP
jgi:hypothetical protein